MDIRSCSESQTHGGSISPENWSGTRDVDIQKFSNDQIHLDFWKIQ